MNKKQVIGKLREMADALESNDADLVSISGTITGDRSYDEFEVSIRYKNMQLEKVNDYTENKMDYPPSSFKK